MSEIKGAPCTRRAHFHGQVHDYWRCAPGVCTFVLAIHNSWVFYVSQQAISFGQVPKLGHVFMCYSLYKPNQKSGKRMYTLGAQVPKSMHLAPKICTQSAGFPPNFEHCLAITTNQHVVTVISSHLMAMCVSTEVHPLIPPFGP